MMLLENYLDLMVEKIVTIGIMISVYGTMNGFTMTAMRVPYAMAAKDQIPLKILG